MKAGNQEPINRAQPHLRRRFGRLPTLAMLVALAAHGEPLAWLRLGDPAGQRYENVPYHWLADAPLHLVIEVAPAGGLALDLLWGAKDDERGAVITANGDGQTVQAGGYVGFKWQRVNLPAGSGQDAYSVAIQPAEPKAAFLAAVRLVEAGSDLNAPLPEASSRGIRVVGPPKSQLELWNEELQAASLNDWRRAAIHGQQANEALRRCRKFVAGWLAHADPKTGLIPRNLRESSHFWNGRDSAADNYAFMVLTCALTDRAMFEGRMKEMLRTETRLTSRIGALPADYDFNKQGFRHDEPDLQRLIFDGSEYVKDGLMPITEWLGPTEWSERMIAIVDTILEQAPHATPAGNIPSDHVEVNGEMMQVLSRLCFMTGEERYLNMACRLADYYLLGSRHPTRDADRLQLDDHSCELISGLTEVYAACHALRPDKAAAYRAPIHAMLDRILEVGTDEYGLMYEQVNPRTGQVLRDHRTDNWGYNYNGFYTVFQLDGVERYRAATVTAMTSLMPHYLKYPWEGWGSDGIADSVEGAINLVNREPDVAGVAEWIDANIARMLDIQKPDGVIEGWHGDGNYARTAIMWALMKQQGVTVQPWREDVRLGAVRKGDGLCLVLSAEKPWEGRLTFDVPRHRTVMKLPLDYPRINQFPEWFTVDENAGYRIEQPIGKPVDPPLDSVSGRRMHEGIPQALRVGEQRTLLITPL